MEAPNDIKNAPEAPQEDGIRMETTLLEAVLGTVMLFGSFWGLYYIAARAEMGVTPW
ncbi:MAG: hypothetical protein AAGG01_20305 [Planctomycetota bacterium]